MSDQPRHKSAVELDELLAKEWKDQGFVTPALMMPLQLVDKITQAIAKAQEDKDRFLGRLPPKIEPQPNVAISKWKHDWATASMNNNRELGPGDTGKKAK